MSDRALRLFDALIKLFHSREHRFEGSTVNVGGQNYEISIREKLKKLDELTKEPTNVLCLKVYAGFPRFKIYDSKSVPIEDGISRVVAEVELEVTTGEVSLWKLGLNMLRQRTLLLRGKISSQVIQALEAIGEKNLSEDVLDNIRSLIMRENLDELNHDLTVATVWISKLIKDSINSYK